MKPGFYGKPRKFRLNNTGITISDYGKILLGPDEMVSFKAPSGGECDFTSKQWGFYPASSLNGRMVDEGFKAALVRGARGKIYINIVEKDKKADFRKYLKSHNPPARVICWLDELDAKKMDMIESLLRKDR